MKLTQVRSSVPCASEVSSKYSMKQKYSIGMHTFNILKTIRPIQEFGSIRIKLLQLDCHQRDGLQLMDLQ